MNETMKPVGTAWLWRGLLLLAVVLAGTLVARYRLIEPMAVATLCERDDAPAWCLLRRLFVFLFAQNVAGMAAVVFGVWCTITRSRVLAFAALCFGAVGLVLYRFDSAVIGVLLAGLVLAREAAGRPEDAERGRA
jgi:hypothetical protein